jgi:hypothetical protein
MRGCLALPFRILALAILLLLGYLAWSYRDEIRRTVHQWTADDPVAPEERGIAVRGQAGPAARRVNELLGAQADSVNLTAAEVASLLDSLATVVAPGAVDSIEITLGADDLSVRARVDTRAVPVSLGAIGSVVRDYEFVEAGGRVVFRQAGRIEWHLDRARVRGIPLPGEVRERLIRRFGRRGEGNAIEFGIPRSVTGVRVRPTGVTLYGTGPAR